MIRPFSTEDANDLFAYHSQPEVMRYLYSEPRSRDACVELARARSKAHSLLKTNSITLACELTSTGQVVGDVTLCWVKREDLQGEIGFVFNPEFQGRGLATEAAREMLRLGFEGYGMHRIISRCDDRNIASTKTMGRLGMQLEAHLVEEELFKGDWSSTFVYAMLDREWRSRTSAR